MSRSSGPPKNKSPELDLGLEMLAGDIYDRVKQQGKSDTPIRIQFSTFIVGNEERQTILAKALVSHPIYAEYVAATVFGQDYLKECMAEALYVAAKDKENPASFPLPDTIPTGVGEGKNPNCHCGHATEMKNHRCSEPPIIVTFPDDPFKDSEKLAACLNTALEKFLQNKHTIDLEKPALPTFKMPTDEFDQQQKPNMLKVIGGILVVLVIAPILACLATAATLSLVIAYSVYKLIILICQLIKNVALKARDKIVHCVEPYHAALTMNAKIHQELQKIASRPYVKTEATSQAISAVDTQAITDEKTVVIDLDIATPITTDTSAHELSAGPG